MHPVASFVLLRHHRLPFVPSRSSFAQHFCPMRRVFEVRRQERAREEAAVRASAVGTGDRSERIRTYNFPQDRITDHRANVSRHGWEAMMRGELLDTFLDALRQRSRTERLKLAGLGDPPN
ncbi:unnamed protein product [Laminaria digitata]